jgi:hypothetical protein
MLGSKKMIGSGMLKSTIGLRNVGRRFVPTEHSSLSSP